MLPCHFLLPTPSFFSFLIFSLKWLLLLMALGVHCQSISPQQRISLFCSLLERGWRESHILLVGWKKTIMTIWSPGGLSKIHQLSVLLAYLLYFIILKSICLLPRLGLCQEHPLELYQPCKPWALGKEWRRENPQMYFKYVGCINQHLRFLNPFIYLYQVLKQIAIYYL